MSFEGYWVTLCANGHRADRGCYDDDKAPCGVCQAEIVWRHLIDQTNDSGDGDVPVLEVTEDKTICKCGHCGHVHELTPVRYVVPEGPVLTLDAHVMLRQAYRAPGAVHVPSEAQHVARTLVAAGAATLAIHGPLLTLTDRGRELATRPLPSPYEDAVAGARPV